MILLVIRVIDDECKFSFWYIEVLGYYVCNFVYLEESAASCNSFY